MIKLQTHLLRVKESNLDFDFDLGKLKKSLWPEDVICQLKVLTAFQTGQTFSEQDLGTRNLI